MDEATLWTQVAHGRPVEARRTAVAAMARSLEAHRWAIALSLAHDLARTGAADEAVGALVQIGDRVDGRLAEARRLHIRGLAASSADQLQAASTAFEAMGADLFAAEAAADAARAARRDGEARRATRLFQRAKALAARCEGARTPALVIPDELTPLSQREREVAMLAARGLPSDEIAERLFLSVRTVDNHLQHVYQKLGIDSRTDLAAAMGEAEATRA
jgi:DNA-binding NarL/FixJ family response regulator